MEGFPRLYASLTLGRIAGSMLAVGLVLFVLQRYHSPQLAGAAALTLTLPGLVLAPVAGALLDRYGRVRLVTVDYVIGAVMLFLIAGLSAIHALPPSLLLAICGASSLTGPLSAAGGRSLVPTVVPGPLWERANAADSASFVLASLVGGPVAGVLVGVAGGEWALATAASLYVLSALAMWTVRDARGHTSSRVLRGAWAGLVYVVRNPTLAGIGLTNSTWGLGFGVLTIAIPVLLLGPLHQGPATVGYLWGLFGAAGAVGGLASGGLKTQGKERRIMVASLAVGAVGVALLPFAGSLAIVAIALAVFGASIGPFDVAFITLRQRRTDPAAYGRVFAVSIALNTIGAPIGSALAGPLIAWSLQGALWVAVAANVLAMIFPIIVIPAEER